MTADEAFAALKLARIKYPNASAMDFYSWEVESTLNEMASGRSHNVWRDMWNTSIAEFDAKWKEPFVSMYNSVVGAAEACCK